MRRGAKISRDVGKIVEFDGQTELKVWNGSECNRIGGTDGTIFPPLLDKEEGILSFSWDLCR